MRAWLLGALTTAAAMWACGEITIVDNEHDRPCRDADGDGHYAGCPEATDCDDRRRSAPGPERCNGEDDDCDGLIDEDFGQLGQPCTVGRCEGRWICDDYDEETLCAAVDEWGTVLPEVCNGADDDCDGRVDEYVAFTGDRCHADGDGRCAFGRFECLGDGLQCRPAVEPAQLAETCDGLDDDCDGVIDEDPAGPECYPGPEGTAGVGACRPGARRCEVARFRACVGAVTPEPERCDGVDEDCDGAVDEGLDCACEADAVRPCPPRPPALDGRGDCVAGEQRCVDGAWGPCEGRVDPRREICDGRDDDCDGAIDEGAAAVGQPCEEGRGECRQAGSTVCFGGRLTCDAVPLLPARELCDSIDRDCDGSPVPHTVGQRCETENGLEGLWQCTGTNPSCHDTWDALEP